MKTQYFPFVGLVLLLMVTGVFWGTWFTLTRSITQFSAQEFIHIGRVIIANVAFPMRFIMSSCILAMVLSVWFHSTKNSLGFYMGLAAIVLILIALVITLLFMVPIDNEIKQWTRATLPADWQNIRIKWAVYHAIRTCASVMSFGCFAWSVIQRNN